MKYSFFFLASVSLLFVFGCNSNSTDSFQSDWSDTSIDRHWAGEEYWLNPLQAWKQADGKLRCEISGGDRNVVILTRSIAPDLGSFEMSVDIERINQVDNDSNETNEQKRGGTQDEALTTGIMPKGLNEQGWVGFQIGLKGQFDDYRDDAIKGIGLSAGITTDGFLFIGSLHDSKAMGLAKVTAGTFTISAQPSGDTDSYELTITYTEEGTQESQSLTSRVHGSWLPGSMAITCSQSTPDTIDYQSTRPRYSDLKDLNKSVGGSTNYAFSNWKISGDKIAHHEERSYGPILWAQHTLSDQIVKMSVQFVPIGNNTRSVALIIDGKKAQTSDIDQNGNNALFRITDWDDTIDHDYKISYTDKANENHIYEGVIKKNPRKAKFKMASLSCVDDRGFPHQDIVDNVASHEPDFIAFHGDQLYERVAGYGVERNSMLDYQRKWYIFGWSFRALMKSTPTVIIPDDHDVFHGNLWGEGGKAADVSKGYGYFGQDSGGYKESGAFVNMVHRTQTGHLPDPYDPTPILQDISVYYSHLKYGGVSFAILGDRQWKTAPKQFFPDAEIENGWPQNTSWNAKTDAYHPDAELLGPRQEAFLEDWVTDWSGDTEFKAVISQTPFCNVATLPAHIWHDKYVPSLKKYKVGEYPTDDRPVADFDSNGWPQNKRDKAIKTIRKGFALHLTGDQHLGSTGQYGVDEYGDGGYWISSPAVANLWPRRWFPAAASDGGKATDDIRKYTGNYEDGFGNKITVKGIANPHDIDREPSMVFDKAPGYSIISFDKSTRDIDIAVWPRWAGPDQAAPDNLPYKDWPIKINQLENYGRNVAGYLSAVEVNGSEVLQVIDEEDDEVLYVHKPVTGVFYPPVFDRSSRYTIRKSKDGKLISSSENLKATKDIINYFRTHDGIKIAYSDKGDGKPVLLLHGFINDGSNWRRAALYDSLLQSGYRVIVPDMRGNGHSDKPQSAEAYANNAEVKDAAALMDHLGIKSYKAVGYSRGSIVLAELLTEDNRITKAVLGGMGADFTDPQWSRRVMFADAFNGVKTTSETKGAVDYAKSIGADITALGHLQTHQPATSQKELRKITIPVLVIAGDLDKDNGDPAQLKALFENGSLTIVMGDHNNTYRGQEFARRVLGFLN